MRPSHRFIYRSLALAAAAAAAACTAAPPTVAGVSPRTLCANIEGKLMITGTEFDSARVEIGRAVDMGVSMGVAAAGVTGDKTSLTATFPANSLTPSDMPYDVIVTNKDGQRAVLPGAVTVVPGISIAAVDPVAVYSGVDFPTSVFGTGMGGITSITVSRDGGMETALTGIMVVDANRVDAIVPKGLMAGLYDVKVVDKDGCTATLAKALTVVSELTVSLCAVDPIFGYDQVDTDVTITSTMNGTAGGATCGGRMNKFKSTPRAWLAIGGALRALRNVAFSSEGTLTAEVPAKLPVGGPYDLVVQNPDGSVGLAPMAFKIVDKPVPQVTAVDPPVVPSNYAGVYKIFGRNFRDPAKVEVYGPMGNLINVPNITVTSATEITINNFSPGALMLPVGAYVVRVTNTDQSTYGEYTAIAVISSSFNITYWTDATPATPIPNAVMRHGAAAGQVSLAARYLYVVGGDTGGMAASKRGISQIAVVDKFGNIGGWFTGRNKLPAERTSLGLMSVPAASGRGGYLYVVGGEVDAGATNTVLRARILLPEDAPQVTKTTVSLGGKLPRGTFYYRVSAVMNNMDAANPMGETLASDEIAAHTVPDGKVTIEWMPVANAAAYNVYRTAMVDGTSGTEVLFKPGVATTSFVDDGSGTPLTGAPLRQGDHGVWVPVESLKQARRAHGLAMAHDPMGGAYLYALGGDTGMGSTAGTVLDTYEFAKLSGDGLTLSAWTAGSSKLASPRTRLQAAVGEHATSPRVAEGTAYVYAVGGWSGTALVESYQPATVQNDGQLSFTAPIASNNILQGLSSIVASNQLFALGGTNAAGVPQKVAKSDIYATPPSFGGLNTNSAASTDVSQTMTIASYAGLVFSSAHFYLLGGTTDGMTALPRVWTNVY